MNGVRSFVVLLGGMEVICYKKLRKVVSIWVPKILIFLVLLLVFDDAQAASKGAVGGPPPPPAAQTSGVAAQLEGDIVAIKVICNVINFVRGIGLPIMTGVIVGSSIMAIFGRLAWPAIAVLVVFTGVFFGADKLISKFASGIGDNRAASFSCS
ncbi:MAG: TrbC/VirB2 family protein [Anaplasma sp.]